MGEQVGRRPASHTPGTYTHGHTPCVTQAMAERTAAREGAFFLPYLRAGMRVLDVGCGPGSITLGLAHAVTPGEVIGLDSAATAVEAARALALDRHIPNVRFVVGTAQALPFPEGSFTAVFAHTLLEHVPDPLAVVRELRRVLAPGGIVGVRDGDVGARLLYPPDTAVQDALALYERLWQHNGGHPQQGREQRALLHMAGFRRLQTSAGTNTLQPSFAADVFAERLTGPPLAETALALGWADRPTLERYAVALRTWGQHPDALWTTIMVETVGWAE